VQGGKRVYCNVKVIAVSEIYKLSVSIYFVPEGQIIHPLTVTVCQTVTERNVSCV
jgi:hypothetical protein